MSIFPAIEFGPDTLASLERVLPLEWLLTDGTGSYASSTVVGCNTRRYHGLLVAAQQPPLDRAVLLAKVEEELWVDGKNYALSTNEYPDVFHPDGHKRLVSFRLRPFPEFLYAAGAALLRKEVILLRGRRAVGISYHLEGAGRAVLRLTPLLACRGFHELSPPETPFAVEHRNLSRGVEVRIRGGHRPLDVYLRVATGEFEPQPLRFHRMTYRREGERGLDREEQLFSPGALIIPLETRRPATFIASAAPLPEVSLETERRREVERLHRLVEVAGAHWELERALTLAADAFLVSGRGAAEAAPAAGLADAVIAGYPWFDVWGRDALIALEGLTLVTGRFAEARAVLLMLAERTVEGVVPNFLGVTPSQDAFNSIDASLWFVHAVARYLDYTGDEATVRQRLWPTVQEILVAYRRGTRYDIRVDRDGLLAGGSRETQLTWMDATVNGQPVTPRHGKAVEVNALWYNALCAAAALAARCGGSPEPYQQQAELVRTCFNEVFWCEESQCLCDCIAGGVRDARLRPNQVLAISLPHPVLDRRRWGPVLAAVREHLYTPLGLRTLAPSEPGYRGTCTGPAHERDSAYHQGTGWAWLLGPYYEAYLKLHGFSQSARRAVAQALQVWSGHLREAGLGTVSEIFDGDPPHRPRGCIAQAWGVAELLRLCRLVRSRPGAQAATPETSGAADCG